MVSLDLAVKLGDLLTLGSFLVGGLGAFFVVRGDLKTLTNVVKMQGAEIKDMKDVVKAQALQQQRMDFLDKQIEDLRVGVGFKIQPREYPSSAPTLFER